MKTLFLDFETSDTVNAKKKRDPSPFIPQNFLVSFGYKTRNYKKDNKNYHFFAHNDLEDYTGLAQIEAKETLQALLDECELLVAFNAKFELEWLLETGFKYDGQIYDPMVVEYVLARGRPTSLDLDSCCARRDAIRKLGNIVSDYWDRGLGFHQMPMAVVQEYGIRDVDCLEDLYDKQQALLELEENKSLLATIQMSNEFIWCLVEMERNGICIDEKALLEIKDEFTKERDSLRRELVEIAREVVGDTPVNLDSPEQLSWLIYSRKVKDKHEWKRQFNIGTDTRGKRLHPPRMLASAFVGAVKRGTEVFKRTLSQHCDTCRGKGRLLDAITKSGRLFKNPPKCSVCGGNGYLLVDTGKIAGFKLSPRGPIDTAAGGFATDKETLGGLISRCNIGTEIGLKAKTFLTKLIRYGAIDTYLSTFIAGIERGTKNSRILHAKLMQCITATGRLSSQDPNFQNMPRAGTFPVRKSVVSRFKNGKIIEVDFAQLEFRAAAYIYQCMTAIQTILDKVDVHAYTASVIGCSRQDAKPHTFKPLYGGTSGTEAEQRYYKAFREKYTGVVRGQDRDIGTVLRTGRLTIPSGRQYDFVGTKRTPTGYVTNTTQICNYPVQGFATADIVPCVIIDLLEEFHAKGLKSLIILTVHDSVVIDVHPDEMEDAVACINLVFGKLPRRLMVRYNLDINVPLDWEIKAGDDWMNMKGVT